MTENEMRELDAWTAEFVMEAKRHSDGWSPGDTYEGGLDCLCSKWQPTIEVSCAFVVLQKCAEKLGELPRITKTGDVWTWANPRKSEPYHSAPTLTLAICLFAKQLFSK